MGKKKKKLQGAEGFLSYYKEQFGERWASLEEALSESGEYKELRYENLEPYYLNMASYLVIEGLNIKPDDTVLDLCAAPGGKSLSAAMIMLSAVKTPEEITGSITSNDLSNARRGRLKKTMQASLPLEFAERIQVTGHDGSRWGLYEQEVYDKIILDAPCSSEGHYIQQPKLQESWSLSRIKRIAITQYALLSAAFTAIKQGGTILYSTCALLPQENDDIVAKLIKRHGEFLEIIPPPEKIIKRASGEAELTQYGFHYLPDKMEGYGPLYSAYIRKRS